MIGLILSLLVMYSIVITTILFAEIKRREKRKDFLWSLVENSGVSENEKISFFIELRKNETQKLPWYSQSISTVGVAVFVSMLAATAYQLIDSYAKNVEVRHANKEVAIAKEREQKSGRLFENSLDLIIEIFGHTGSVSVHAKDTLIEFLKTLDDVDLESLKDDRKLRYLRIAFLVQDYSTAARIFKSSKSIRDSANAEEMLTLAEWYFYKRDNIESGRLIQKTLEKADDLSHGSIIKLAALNDIVAPSGSGESDQLYNKIARLKRMKLTKVKELVDEIKTELNKNLSVFQQRFQ